MSPKIYASLRYYGKNGLSLPFALNNGKTTIGTEKSCNIRLKGEDADLFCSLHFDRVQNAYLINERLDSRITINGEAPSSEFTILTDGDEIQIGNKKFRYNSSEVDDELVEQVDDVLPVARKQLVASRRFSEGTKVAGKKIPKISERNLVLKNTPFKKSSSPLEVLKENELLTFSSPPQLSSELSPRRSHTFSDFPNTMEDQQSPDQKSKTFSGNLREKNLNSTTSSCESITPGARKTYSGNISDVSDIATTPENHLSAASITPLNVSKKTKRSLNRSKSLLVDIMTDQNSTPKSIAKSRRSADVYQPVVEEITPVSPLSRQSMMRNPAFSQRRSIAFDIPGTSDESDSEGEGDGDGDGSSNSSEPTDVQPSPTSTPGLYGKKDKLMNDSSFLKSLVEESANDIEVVDVSLHETTDLPSSSSSEIVKNIVSDSINVQSSFNHLNESLSPLEIFKNDDLKNDEFKTPLPSKSRKSMALDGTLDNSVKRKIYNSLLDETADENPALSAKIVSVVSSTPISMSKEQSFEPSFIKEDMIKTPLRRSVRKRNSTIDESVFETSHSAHSSAKEKSRHVDKSSVALAETMIKSTKDESDITETEAYFIDSLVKTPKSSNYSLVKKSASQVFDKIILKDDVSETKTPEKAENSAGNKTPKSTRSAEKSETSETEKSLNNLPEIDDTVDEELNNTPNTRKSSDNEVKKQKTPKKQKSPENELSDFVGVKKLMRTPRVQKSPKNDLSNFVGVKKLLRTPKGQKSPENDLSNVAGVKKLLKTPKAQKSPENDLSNIAGVKKLLKTPTVQKSPKNDLCNVAGVKKLMKTPKIQKSPENDLSNISGVQCLFPDSPEARFNEFAGKKPLRTYSKSPKKTETREVSPVPLVQEHVIQWVEEQATLKPKRTPRKVETETSDVENVNKDESLTKRNGRNKKTDKIEMDEKIIEPEQKTRTYRKRQQTEEELSEKEEIIPEKKTRATRKRQNTLDVPTEKEKIVVEKKTRTPRKSQDTEEFPTEKEDVVVEKKIRATRKKKNDEEVAPEKDEVVVKKKTRAPRRKQITEEVSAEKDEVVVEKKTRATRKQKNNEEVPPEKEENEVVVEKKTRATRKKKTDKEAPTEKEEVVVEKKTRATRKRKIAEEVTEERVEIVHEKKARTPRKRQNTKTVTFEKDGAVVERRTRTPRKQKNTEEASAEKEEVAPENTRTGRKKKNTEEVLPEKDEAVVEKKARTTRKQQNSEEDSAEKDKVVVEKKTRSTRKKKTDEEAPTDKQEVVVEKKTRATRKRKNVEEVPEEKLERTRATRKRN